MTRPALTPGDRVELALDPVELRDIVRYAGASGDFNPIHYDDRLARSSGYRTNFAQGMFTAGLLGAIVGERFGPERIRRFGVRFVAPLWCGDEPQVTCRVERVEDGRAHLDLEVAVGGEAVVRGWAELDLETGHPTREGDR